MDKTISNSLIISTISKIFTKNIEKKSPTRLYRKNLSLTSSSLSVKDNISEEYNDQSINIK
jgi:hypothetical protein